MKIKIETKTHRMVWNPKKFLKNIIMILLTIYALITIVDMYNVAMIKQAENIKRAEQYIEYCTEHNIPQYNNLKK